MNTQSCTLKVTAPIFVGLYFMLSLASANEIPLSQCPKTLAVQQTVQASDGNSWKVASGGGVVPLMGTWISDGEYPTIQTGFNIPSEEKRLPNGDVLVYSDLYIPTGKSVHDYWAVCRYHNTEAVLVRRIPVEAKYCEARIFYDYPKKPEKELFKCFDTPRGRTK